MTRFSTIALAASLALIAGPTLSEEIKLDDGTTCTIVQSQAGNTSTTVTAGNGQVSSSTTTGSGAAGSSSSSASAGSSAGSGSVDSFSTASITRPDGTVITKRSDGTCSVSKPTK